MLRTDCDSYNGGYDLEVKLPITELTLGKRIGFDVVVTSGDGRKAYLNDILGTQESTTMHYAEAILKPGQGSITQGTAVVDGQAEDIWKTANVFWLNMNDGDAKAAAKVKLLWDEAKLYVYAEIQDEDAGEGDALTIYLDENHGATAAYDEDDKQIRISRNGAVATLGKKADVASVESVVTAMGNGYIIEASIPWTDLTPKAYSQLGFELKVIDADESGAVKGTISWFDNTQAAETGSAAFGFISLAGAAKEKEDTENSDASFSKAGSFTGLVEQSEESGQEQTATGDGSDNGSAADQQEQPKKNGSMALWLIAVLVGACGGAGYYVLRKRNKKTDSGDKKEKK